MILLSNFWPGNERRERMNFNTIKQELYKKIKKMSEEDFMRFIAKLEDIYYKNKPWRRNK